jgi:hypothetical protein
MVTKVVKNASSLENLPLDTPLLTYVHKGKLPKNPLLGSRSQSHDTTDDQRDYFHHYSTNNGQQPQQPQDQDDNESIGNGSLSDIPKDSTFYQSIYSRQGYPAASNAQFSSQQQQQHQMYYQQSQLSSGHPPSDYLSFSSVSSNPHPSMNDPYDPSKPPLQYKQLLKGIQPVNPHNGSFSLRDFLKGCTTANSSNYSTSSSVAAPSTNVRGKSFPTNYNPNLKKHPQQQRPTSSKTYYNESSSNTSCGDESTLQDDYIDENENEDDLQQIAVGRYHEDHPAPSPLTKNATGSHDATSTSFQQHLINENIQLKTRNGLNICDLNLSISPTKEERRRKEEQQQHQQQATGGGNDELSSQFLSSHSSDEYTLSPKELSKALLVASASPSKKKKGASMRDIGSGANTDNEGSHVENERYPPFLSTTGSRDTSPYRSGKTRGNSITTSTSSRHSSPAISRQNSRTNIVYPYSQQGQHLHEQSVVTMNTYTHPKTKKVMVDKSIQSNQLRHAQLTKQYDGSLNDFMVYTEIVHDKATDMDYDLLLTMNDNINLDYYNEEEIDLMKKSLHNPLLLMHQVMDLKRQVSFSVS